MSEILEMGFVADDRSAGVARFSRMVDTATLKQNRRVLPKEGFPLKAGAPETATTLCLVRNANVPSQTINGIEIPICSPASPNV